MTTLADQLFATANLPIDRKEFVAQVLQRENTESTCVGHGLMIPHAILDADSQLEGVLGINVDGLNFKTPDNRPVHAVLLLATPEKERQRHLEILSAFARLITHDENLCEQLYHARSAAHAYNILHAEDAEDINYYLEDVMDQYRGADGTKVNADA